MRDARERWMGQGEMDGGDQAGIKLKTIINLKKQLKELTDQKEKGIGVMSRIYIGDITKCEKLTAYFYNKERQQGKM